MLILEQARQRNLLIKIAHAVIEDGLEMDKDFGEKDLVEKFYFKKSDVKDFKGKIFDEGSILKEVKDRVNLYIENHKENKNYKEEEKFEDLYFKLDNYFKTHNSDEDKFQQDIVTAKEIAIKLHWKYLPLYTEQFMVNNGVLPEESPEYYYNHFHAIEDLYRYIFTENKLNWRSIDGDINLDKVLKFKVYTTRWGHYDNYRIKRTYDGWFVSHISINGNSEKNGEGALLDNLNHDSVVFPVEGVKYALEVLWNEADTTSMTLEQLQRRIDEIALWIEEVEKVTHKFQPDWCGYY